MPRFRQTIMGQATVYVEAKDMYEADELVAAMSTDEILSQGDIDFYAHDTDEFPEEA